MKLYGRLIFMGLQKTLAARAAVLLYLFLSVLQTLLAIGVWLVAQRSMLKSATSERTLLTYFTFIILFQAFVWSGISRRVGQIDIRKGQLSLWLLKPVSYHIVIFLEEISWRIIRSLITIPVFLFFLILFRDTISFSWSWFFFSLLFFPLGYMIYFLVQFISGALAFWLEDIEEFTELIEVLMILFSGVGIPIFLFPPLLQLISKLLPFQYTLYFPTIIALGMVSLPEILSYVLIALTWIFGLALLLRVVWKQGLYKYSAEGI